MSPSPSPATPTGCSFPRVSGDEPEPSMLKAYYYGFSPRERG